MPDTIPRLDLKSKSLSDEQKEKLRQFFPEVFTEDKLDWERLQITLGTEIETDKERFGLTWRGKAECFKIILEPSIGTLKPVKGESIGWVTTGNVFVEGDNLEALKLLQKSYYGKIKMIYIDPPYNTGKEFIYPDKYSETLDTYLAYTGQIDSEGKKFSTNTETAGRYHSNWLNMMYPRLFLARNLLRDDGVIFVSIDDHEVHNLRAMMNEIFGEENFVALLTVINNMKGRNDKENVATCNEFLLIYSKLHFESYGLPLTEEQLSQYKNFDETGEKYALRDLRKRGSQDRREDRENMYIPIFYNPLTKKCSLIPISGKEIEIVPKRGDGSDGRWRWGIDRIRDNLKYLHPRYKERQQRWDIDHRVYLNPNIMADIGDEEVDDDDILYERTSKSKSFWWGGSISTDVANREFKKLFDDLSPDYPKSPFFIKKVLQMSTRNNDLILDFFSGYSTTAHAVLELNKEDSGRRKFIMIQLPEILGDDSDAFEAGYKTIADIGKERIRRVIKKIKNEQKEAAKQKTLPGNVPAVETETPLDLGFRVFKLDKSNFKVWDGRVPANGKVEKQLEDFIENLRVDGTDDDILFELLLKSGFELSTKVVEKTIAGKKVYSIEDDTYLLCLEHDLTKELIIKIAEMKPARVICLDVGFKGNDQLRTNALEIMKSHGVADFRTV